jgi:glucose-1-phosphate cytidylyltransferase
MIADFAGAADWPDGVAVEVVDTGADTPTGGRIHRLRDRVGAGTFMVTYADGVADIDLGALLARHRAHGDVATVTVVRPELQFGVAVIGDGDCVTGFREKPRSEHWINGGFFCFEAAALRALPEGAVLERGPLEDLATRGELYAYRHEGFWDCMDTYKDAVLLNDLWAAGQAPWRVWA